jgi:hypothetical protein
MKCSKCGKRFNSLPAMAKHYRKKHPAAMKRKVKIARSRTSTTAGAPGHKFCPHCGGFLG